MEALENVIDPELGLDFVSLGPRLRRRDRGPRRARHVHADDAGVPDRPAGHRADEGVRERGRRGREGASRRWSSRRRGPRSACPRTPSSRSASSAERARIAPSGRSGFGPSKLRKLRKSTARTTDARPQSLQASCRVVGASALHLWICKRAAQPGWRSRCTDQHLPTEALRSLSCGRRASGHLPCSPAFARAGRRPFRAFRPTASGTSPAAQKGTSPPATRTPASSELRARR